MRRIGRNRQKGFSLIELIIVMGIGAILASIAIAQMRDYTRRARITEVMMALGGCRSMVSENYLTLDRAPQPGRWGCEGGGVSQYAGSIETSSDGVIRVPITNMDRLVDGRFIYLVPAKSNSSTPMTTLNDLGKGVAGWICGSDWLPVRNALPANCRTDTTTFASQDFQ
jgi:prepilin-type N-terminal cleavage/methylation domain-containing protein